MGDKSKEERLRELKALAYDCIAAKEQAEAGLRDVNRQIVEVMSEKESDSE